jgi:hypothetical protein
MHADLTVSFGGTGRSGRPTPRMRGPPNASAISLFTF